MMATKHSLDVIEVPPLARAAYFTTQVNQQIPALLLPTAAAIIVTRGSESAEITEQVHKQMLASPSLLFTVAGILVVLGSMPGVLHLAFFSFAATREYSA